MYFHAVAWSLQLPSNIMLVIISFQFKFNLNVKEYIDGLEQERRNSSALTVELRLSCANPSILGHFNVEAMVSSAQHPQKIYIHLYIYIKQKELSSFTIFFSLAVSSPNNV